MSNAVRSLCRIRDNRRVCEEISRHIGAAEGAAVPIACANAMKKTNAKNVRSGKNVMNATGKKNGTNARNAKDANEKNENRKVVLSEAFLSPHFNAFCYRSKYRFLRI